MIHVDSERDILEFKGSGADLITEIAGIIAASTESAAMTLDEEAYDKLVDMITASIGMATKVLVKSTLEELKGEGSDEEGHVKEERDREDVPTVVKQFRRGRKGRSLS